MKIAIVGGGYMGLTAAIRLKQFGHDVTVYEASSSSGGLAGTFRLDNGALLEVFYHHLFVSDKSALELVQELGLSDELEWRNSNMGYFTSGKIHKFGTPLSLLQFSPLSFWEKIRFGLSVLKMQKIDDWRKIESSSAHTWLLEACGPKAYQVVWEPLLRSKFGERYKEISMAWFWAKVALRAKNRNGDKEKLGYFRGSFDVLTKGMMSKLKSMSVPVYMGSPISSVVYEHNAEDVLVNLQNGDSEQFDRVLLTTPMGLATKLVPQIPTNIRDSLASIEYTAVVCTVLEMNKKFSDVYWLNVGDRNIPFGGLIEHTNMVPKERYGKHILYISNYLYADNPLFNMNDDDIYKTYVPYLKQINPNFNPSDVSRVHVFRARHAQPVITTDYSKPSFDSGVPGIYLANMTHIYP